MSLNREANLHLEELYALQQKLAGKVSLKDGFKLDDVEYIAGCDLAYAGEKVYCAVVVLEYPSLEVAREKIIKTTVSFPYIPTLLAFREKDSILKAAKGLHFDVMMVDGQGIAHPRGLGIASHVGVLLNKPTIGVAKSRLCGEVKGAIKYNSPAPLMFEGKQVGYALITKKGTTPIFISPGHRISLKTTVDLVRRCIRGHKLPEPTRLAHMEATSARKI